MFGKIPAEFFRKFTVIFPENFSAKKSGGNFREFSKLQS